MLDVYAFIDYKRGIYPHPYLKSSSHFFLQDTIFFFITKETGPLSSLTENR